MICDCNACSNSSATETIIKSPVALNTLTKLWSTALKIIEGINATNAKNIAPKRVILFDTLRK